jgi:hypothetical protein
VGCCENNDEPLGSGATELVSYFVLCDVKFKMSKRFTEPLQWLIVKRKEEAFKIKL